MLPTGSLRIRTLLEGILSDQKQLEEEERLIERLLERIDVKHIRPILNHLNQQDQQVEDVTSRILDEVRKYHIAAAQ